MIPQTSTNTVNNKTFESVPGLILRLTIFSYLILVVGLSSFSVFLLWVKPSILSFPHPTRAIIYLFAFFSGISGGAIYSLRGFYQRHADKTLDLFLWWPWYLARPWHSGVFTAFVVALLNAGILILQFKATSNSAVVGLSFLIGLGFHQVNKKIEDTIDTLFSSKRKDKTPDQESQEKTQANQERPLQM